MDKPLALIIEDDPALSEIFSLSVSSAGFDTEAIQDGQAAIDRLTGVAPTMIVLDLHLPHVNGWTILEQIRANERFEKTVVIVASADAQSADSLQNKADLVLLKPVSVDQLRDLAKRFLLRWQTSQA